LQIIAALLTVREKKPKAFPSGQQFETLVIGLRTIDGAMKNSQWQAPREGMQGHGDTQGREAAKQLHPTEGEIAALLIPET